MLEKQISRRFAKTGAPSSSRPQGWRERERDSTLLLLLQIIIKIGEWRIKDMRKQSSSWSSCYPFTMGYSLRSSWLSDLSVWKATVVSWPTFDARVTKDSSLTWDTLFVMQREWSAWLFLGLVSLFSINIWSTSSPSLLENQMKMDHQVWKKDSLQSFSRPSSSLSGATGGDHEGKLCVSRRWERKSDWHVFLQKRRRVKEASMNCRESDQTPFDQKSVDSLFFPFPSHLSRHQTQPHLPLEHHRRHHDFSRMFLFLRVSWMNESRVCLQLSRLTIPKSFLVVKEEETPSEENSFHFLLR